MKLASLISKFYLITRSHKGWPCYCNISQLSFPNHIGCVLPFHQARDPNTSTYRNSYHPWDPVCTCSGPWLRNYCCAAQRKVLNRNFSPDSAEFALHAPYFTWGQEAEEDVVSGREDSNKFSLQAPFVWVSLGDVLVSHLENLFRSGLQKIDSFCCR